MAMNLFSDRTSDLVDQLPMSIEYYWGRAEGHMSVADFEGAILNIHNVRHGWSQVMDRDDMSKICRILRESVSECPLNGSGKDFRQFIRQKVGKVIYRDEGDVIDIEKGTVLYNARGVFRDGTPHRCGSRYDKETDKNGMYFSSHWLIPLGMVLEYGTPLTLYKYITLRDITVYKGKYFYSHNQDDFEGQPDKQNHIAFNLWPITDEFRNIHEEMYSRGVNEEMFLFDGCESLKQIGVEYFSVEEARGAVKALKLHRRFVDIDD